MKQNTITIFLFGRALVIIFLGTKQSVVNSVALSVAIAVALCSTADFLYHRSRKKTKRPEALAERAKQRRHLSLRGGSPVGFRYKKKNPSLNRLGFQRKATTYSPTNCSTICAGGLNFSVRDGKR